jgi:hypothetical protein
VTPAALSLACTVSARPVEYVYWSSMM